MTPEFTFGCIALILLGVFAGGYVYDTCNNKTKSKQKP